MFELSKHIGSVEAAGNSLDVYASNEGVEAVFLPEGVLTPSQARGLATLLTLAAREAERIQGAISSTGETVVGIPASEAVTKKEGKK